MYVCNLESGLVSSQLWPGHLAHACVPCPSGVSPQLHLHLNFKLSGSFKNSFENTSRPTRVMYVPTQFVTMFRVTNTMIIISIYLPTYLFVPLAHVCMSMSSISRTFYVPRENPPLDKRVGYYASCLFAPPYLSIYPSASFVCMSLKG